MAQYVHQYVSALLNGQAAAGVLLGVDIYGVSREVWVMNLTQLTITGMVMKKISELAGVSDADWLDALSHALDADPLTAPWPADMLNQVKPGTVPPVE